MPRKTVNFQTPISLSQRENTPFRNDKLEEKLLRNTRQFQQRKSHYINEKKLCLKDKLSFDPADEQADISRRSLKPRTFLVMFEHLQLRESYSQEITGLIVNLYLSLNTFLIDRFFVFLIFLCFAKFLKTVVCAQVRSLLLQWTCSSFKLLARLSSRIKNCTPLLLRTKTYVNKFFI